MSLFSPVSLFKESNFKIQFKDGLPAIEIMVNVAQIPGFNIGQLEIPRPGIIDKRPSEHLTFDDLSVEVLCDEKLEVFKELHGYVLKTSNPFTANYEVEYPVFDSTLFLTTNKNNLQHTIRFYNCFFKSIGPIGLTNATTEDKHVTFNLVIAYTFFNFE